MHNWEVLVEGEEDYFGHSGEDDLLSDPSYTHIKMGTFAVENYHTTFVEEYWIPNPVHPYCGDNGDGPD